MKTLVVYYSRSNITKEIAKEIQNELNCDIEEIKPLKDYDGKTGYAKAGYESMTKKTPKIEDAQHNPADYDLAVIGTPVWASTMASPVYTYLSQNKGKFNNVAFFATCGGSGDESTLKNMAKLVGKEGIATYSATKRTVGDKSRLKEFTDALKQ
ncbi:MAG: flavodoxin [Methanobrevibacter sp.]|jgi:flavodoxin|nr:flavodoxin [Methanobrevibacter sp.]